MQTAITVFAWIGLATASLLVLTVAIWCIERLKEQAIDTACLMFAMALSTYYFFIMSRVVSPRKMKDAAGKLLWSRHWHLSKRDPEIAAAFEREFLRSIRERDDD